MDKLNRNETYIAELEARCDRYVREYAALVADYNHRTDLLNNSIHDGCKLQAQIKELLARPQTT